MIEVNPVKEAVREKLLVMLERREYPLEAKLLFQVWYRLETHPHGRPRYPKFSWSTLVAYLQPQKTVPFQRVVA